MQHIEQYLLKEKNFQLNRGICMKISIIYKEENGWYVGHIQEYPEFESQGQNLDELKENLLDIYKDIQKGLIPDITPSKVLELII